MFIKKNIGLLFILFIILFASCNKPNQSNKKERFVVTSNNLNIRNDPTQLSKTIGTLAKGDTVIALASDNYWIMIKAGNQTGFVSNQYLKRLGPPPIPAIIMLIEKNADWGKWQFWVIAVALIAVWAATQLGFLRYVRNLKRKQGIGSKNISFSPLTVFVASILTALLYLFWKDDVIDSLFVNFNLIPQNAGYIAWFIWSLCVTVLISIIIDLISAIYYSGIKYGFITFTIEQGINAAILATTFFLTISLFLAAIVFLIVFFAILYTIIVTENSKSQSGFIPEK